MIGPRGRVRAVLFDLDDTLVAFEAVTGRSWWQVCEGYARRGCAVPVADLVARIKECSDRYWADPERHRWGRMNMLEARRHIARTALASLGLPGDDASVLAERYTRIRLENMYLIEGVRPALERLRAEGRVLGLLTNGDGAGQRDKVRRFGLDPYFELVLVEGELGYGKPDARVYETALGRLGVEPGETRMVGDNLGWDVEGAQTVGIPAIWIDRAGSGLPPRAAVRPWRIARRVAEVPDLLPR